MIVEALLTISLPKDSAAGNGRNMMRNIQKVVVRMLMIRPYLPAAPLMTTDQIIA